MKKILSSLFFGFSSIFSVFTKAECEESVSEVATWKDSLTAHWDNLTEMHKMIIYSIIIFFLLWVLYKSVRYGLDGCGCAGNDNSHK